MAIEIKLEKNIAGILSSKLQAELNRAIQETALAIEADAKTKAPVDTGALRASIAAGPDFVAVGAEYGPYVELGTSRAGAQPFLTPAVEAQREPFEQRIADALKRAAE